VHAAVLYEVRAAILRLGLVPTAVIASRLRGPAGNVEFFMLVRERGEVAANAALDLALASVPE
jgi:predicted rRNA methylase YqxC with S4 and FtsJ domains